MAAGAASTGRRRGASLTSELYVSTAPATPCRSGTHRRSPFWENIFSYRGSADLWSGASALGHAFGSEGGSAHICFTALRLPSAPRSLTTEAGPLLKKVTRLPPPGAASGGAARIWRDGYKPRRCAHRSGFGRRRCATCSGHVCRRLSASRRRVCAGVRRGRAQPSPRIAARDARVPTWLSARIGGDGSAAFAMPEGERIVGFLLVGPKRDALTYAPDELRALGLATREAGIAMATRK